MLHDEPSLLVVHVVEVVVEVLTIPLITDSRYNSLK